MGIFLRFLANMGFFFRILANMGIFLALFQTAGGTVLFCVHGAQRAFGEQAECTQNKTEPAALAAATGNRKGAVAPLQCQGVWGRNAPNSLNRTPDLEIWDKIEWVVSVPMQAEFCIVCWRSV